MKDNKGLKVRVAELLNQSIEIWQILQIWCNQSIRNMNMNSLLNKNLLLEYFYNGQNRNVHNIVDFYVYNYLYGNCLSTHTKAVQ